MNLNQFYFQIAFLPQSLQYHHFRITITWSHNLYLIGVQKFDDKFSKKSNFCVMLLCVLYHQLFLFYIVIIYELDIFFFYSKMAQNELNYEICENCQKQFAATVLPIHLGYCKRNIKKCQECGEMYDKNYQDQHLEQFHKTKTCPNCLEEIKVMNFPDHSLQCSPKETFCGYCELKIPDAQFANHLKQCEARTKVCQKCEKHVRNKDYFQHYSNCTGKVQTPVVRGRRERPLTIDSDGDIHQNYREGTKKAHLEKGEKDFFSTFQQKDKKNKDNEQGGKKKVAAKERKKKQQVKQKEKKQKSQAKPNEKQKQINVIQIEDDEDTQKKNLEVQRKVTRRSRRKKDD